MIGEPEPARRTITGREHDQLVACRGAILGALGRAMDERRERSDWVEHERIAVVDAANMWALRHGGDTVTVAEVEAVEHLSMGHVDYASKLALHVAEMVFGLRVAS